MSRRERTTALPRQREGTLRTTSSQRTVFGRGGEGAARLVILGIAVLLLVIVAGALAYRVYANNVLRPNNVVLTVGEDKVKLKYYTDRLYEFALANSQVSVPVLQSSLLTKLEEESLTVQLARERGIDLSDEAVTESIANKLGVPVGGSGSAFDSRYRAELSRVGMSDDNYRRLATAELADTKLREQITAEVGDAGEVVTLRAVASISEEESQSVFNRITGGEDMGTIAQTESLDLGSRTTDGVQSAAPPKLFPDELQEALEGKADKELFGPVEIGSQWWVFRVESRDPEGPYTDSQKTALAGIAFDDAIAAKRATLKITRSLSASDAEWAREHTDGDPAAIPQDSSATGVTVTP